MFIAIVIVNAEARFNRRAHRRDAVGDDHWLRDQTRAKAPGLYAIAGATHIEIDFAVTGFFPELSGRGKFARHAAAELQHHRCFHCVVGEKAFLIPTRDRSRNPHFGIPPRVLRYAAREIPKMTVGVLHHRGQAEAPTICMVLNFYSSCLLGKFISVRDYGAIPDYLGFFC